MKSRQAASRGGSNFLDAIISKLAHLERSGMHKFCYPRWVRSKMNMGYDRYTSDCIKYGLLSLDENEANAGYKVR